MSFLSIERDGRLCRLAVVRTARGVWVGWPGGAKFFGPERAVSNNDGGEVAVAEVRAPMTGRVVKVPVVPGGAVKVDDLLVILQAMKMEYRLTSPRDGTVTQVFCAEGEMVDLGSTLVTLAPRGDQRPAPVSAPSPAPAPQAAPSRTSRRRPRGKR